ncbi:MAG TPA: hypothetical protein VNJ02_01595 [Vicinamibacterales bacterium]|nr:hypothetical protein [Vicinamibacterales bacterium]
MPLDGVASVTDQRVEPLGVPRRQVDLADASARAVDGLITAGGDLSRESRLSGPALDTTGGQVMREACLVDEQPEFGEQCQRRHSHAAR